MDRHKYIVGANALNGEDNSLRQARLRNKLEWWHEAADGSSLPKLQKGVLYFTFKGWLALMEAGGRGLNQITERDMARVIARDVKETWGYLQELDRLGWIEIYDHGRGGPAYPVEEHRSAIYGLGNEQLLMPLLDMKAEQAYQTDLHDGCLAKALDEYRNEIWDEYEDPETTFDRGTSPAHHYLRDIYVGVDIEEKHQECMVIDNKVQRLPGDSDGLVTWRPEMGRLTNLIPEDHIATSPLDYMTASDAWVKQNSGIRGWLLARQVVGWSRIPGWVHEEAHTFSAPDIARMIGMGPTNGDRFAKRLRDRGFAKETCDGRWYLLFDDLFRDGRFFFVDERQQHLRERLADKRKDEPVDAETQAEEDAHRPPRTRFNAS